MQQIQLDLASAKQQWINSAGIIAKPALSQTSLSDKYISTTRKNKA